jgi:hypothetical protein
MKRPQRNHRKNEGGKTPKDWGETAEKSEIIKNIS